MPPERRLRIGETLRARYSTVHGREKGSFRGVLTTGLGEFTGDTLAVMWWAATRFRDDVFVKYGVKLIGWPKDVEFANMSNLKNTPTAKVRRLLEYWENGWMRWAWATPGEILAARESVYNAIPGVQFPNLEIGRGQRSDFGAHRERPVTNPGNVWGKRYIRDGPKSGRELSDEQLLEDADGVVAEDGPEEVEDADDWEREAWRTRRLPSGELADDPIESF